MGRPPFPSNSPIAQMTQRMVDNGVVPSVLMAMAAYPQVVPICMHGVRTLQWILEVPSQSLVHIMLDEEVMRHCADLLERHDDPRVLQFLCGVLVKFCYYLGRICGGLRGRRGGSRRAAAAASLRARDAGKEDGGAVRRGRCRACGHSSVLRAGVDA